jgi:hypothetical protein
LNQRPPSKRKDEGGRDSGEKKAKTAAKSDKKK